MWDDIVIEHDKLHKVTSDDCVADIQRYCVDQLVREFDTEQTRLLCEQHVMTTGRQTGKSTYLSESTRNFVERCEQEAEMARLQTTIVSALMDAGYGVSCIHDEIVVELPRRINFVELRFVI